MLCDKSELLIVSKYLRLSVKFARDSMIRTKTRLIDHNMVSNSFEFDIIMIDYEITISLDTTKIIIYKTNTYFFYILLSLLFIVWNVFFYVWSFELLNIFTEISISISPT